VPVTGSQSVLASSGVDFADDLGGQTVFDDGRADEGCRRADEVGSRLGRWSREPVARTSAPHYKAEQREVDAPPDHTARVGRDRLNCIGERGAD
jgi:hypothetical protein